MAAIKANQKPTVPLLIKRDLIHKVPKSLHVSGLLAANNTLQEGDLTKLIVRSGKCSGRIKGKENVDVPLSTERVSTRIIKAPPSTEVQLTSRNLDAPLSTERTSTRIIKAPPSTEVQLPSRQGSST